MRLGTSFKSGELFLWICRVRREEKLMSLGEGGIVWIKIRLLDQALTLYCLTDGSGGVGNDNLQQISEAG